MPIYLTGCGKRIELKIENHLIIISDYSLFCLLNCDTISAVLGICNCPDNNDYCMTMHATHTHTCTHTCTYTQTYAHTHRTHWWRKVLTLRGATLALC